MAGDDVEKALKRLREVAQTFAVATDANGGLEAAARWHEAQADDWRAESAKHEAEYRAARPDGSDPNEVFCRRAERQWSNASNMAAIHGDCASSIRAMKAPAPKESTT